MTQEIWTDEDELGYQIGDMDGEWQTEESKEDDIERTKVEEIKNGKSFIYIHNKD